MGRPRGRTSAILLALVVVLLGAALWRAPPTAAHACLTVTVYLAGSPSTSGPHCQSVADEWTHTCPTVSRQEQGYGVEAVVCAPDPPARSHYRQ